MPDDENQPRDTPKRPRTPRSPRRVGRKQTAQATLSATPEQEAAAPIVPNKAGSATTQPPSAPEAPALPTPDEPPIGERWGEFPPPERQAELRKKVGAWEQGQDQESPLAPFAFLNLASNDVYWLAALALGAGDADVGKRLFDGKTIPTTDLFKLRNLNLAGAFVNAKNLKGAILSFAHLEDAILREAHLEGAVLWVAHLERADLERAHLEGASLTGARLEGSNLRGAHLEGARLNKTHLEGANLEETHLEGSNLEETHLEGAKLNGARLEGANLRGAQLGNHANLREATLDAKTYLVEAHPDETLQVADVAWNGVSLIRVDWGQVPRLGDEAVARQAHKRDGKNKDKDQRLKEFASAARAYRQLAIALRSQGITEAADRFTYRALIMQRKALWWQMRSIPLLTQPTKKEEAKQTPKQLQSSPLRRAAQQIGNWPTGILALGRLIGPYLFSWFLAVLTGYGFRMSRIVVAYLFLICGFAGAYWSVGVHQPRDISFWTALIVSVTAFHGRVFTNPFAPNIPDAQVVITAIEAIVGLVIEGVFIAMLTQRFFNR